MAYDEDLAGRVRDILRGDDAVGERRMFGGLAFLVGGHMAVAVSGQGGLLLRVDPAQAEALLAEPCAERFVMRGRELDGWLHVHVDAAGDGLERWVALGAAAARSLPPKAGRG